MPTLMLTTSRSSQSVAPGQMPDYLRVGNAMRIIPVDWTGTPH